MRDKTAIIMVLKKWFKIKKINEIKKLRGKLAIENNLEELRSKDKKKIKND